jgi:hypothetical protein
VKKNIRITGKEQQQGGQDNVIETTDGDSRWTEADGWQNEQNTVMWGWGEEETTMALSGWLRWGAMGGLGALLGTVLWTEKGPQEPTHMSSQPHSLWHPTGTLTLTTEGVFTQQQLTTLSIRPFTSESWLITHPKVRRRKSNSI